MNFWVLKPFHIVQHSLFGMEHWQPRKIEMVSNRFYTIIICLNKLIFFLFGSYLQFRDHFSSSLFYSFWCVRQASVCAIIIAQTIRHKLWNEFRCELIIETYLKLCSWEKGTAAKQIPSLCPLRNCERQTSTYTQFSVLGLNENFRQQSQHICKFYYLSSCATHLNGIFSLLLSVFIFRFLLLVGLIKFYIYIN